MSRKGWIYGSALNKEKDGIRYFSPSALMTADPGTSEGCPRRYWYQYKKGLKQEATKAQKIGTELHAQNEHYLLTGEKAMGQLALAGHFMLPKPKPIDDRILIEHDIGGGAPDLSKATLFARGIPIVGSIDCVHWQGVNPGATDVMDTVDPDRTVEVIDWKCLAAGTEIYDVLHARRRDVSEPGALEVVTYDTPSVGETPYRPLVQSIGEATCFESGTKPCVKVTLRDGTSLVASEDHPVMTQRGWIQAGQLQPDSDYVAVPTAAPEPSCPTIATDDEVIFIAYMLSDGCCTRPTDLGFTNMTPEVVEEFTSVATRLGYRVREDKSKSKARQFRLYWGGGTNQLRERWDLYGLAKEKRAHSSLWGLPTEQVKLFLNRFWACDGFISHHTVGVELASEHLVDDLKFLLLRLGIRSRKSKRERGQFTSWSLTMNGVAANQFLEVVGPVLGKEANAIHSPGTRSMDRVPITTAMVQEILDEVGLTKYPGKPVSNSRLAAKHLLNPTRVGTVQRRKFLEFCDRYNYSGKYALFNTRDVAWEPVHSVIESGLLQVYDLNVPHTHSFSANGVVVHNTTSDPKWIKTATEVSKTLQMTVYGKWATTNMGAEWVRLSHGYYVTKGRHTPRKVSLRVHRDQIDERWEYVEQLAGSITEIVRETNPDKVPANTRACDAFRGCPHQQYCSAASHNSLASIIGSHMAANLLGIEHEEVLMLPTTEELTRQSTGQGMSLLASLQNQAAAKADTKPEVAAEMKRLVLEETNTKYPGLKDAFVRLQSAGLGMPALGGEAAKAYAALFDLEFKGEGFAGSGTLAKHSFMDPALIPQVAAEAEQLAHQQKTAGVIATPAEPAAPAETPTAPTAVVNPFPADAPPSPAAPEVVKEEAKPIENAADAIAAAAEETPKKKRGRPPKKKDEPKHEEVAVAPETPAPAQDPARAAKLDAAQEHRLAKEAQGSTAINLFVDCIPSCEHKSLWPIVYEITGRMAKEFGGSDYRTTDPSGPLGFGRWKGVLAACLREIEIEGGNYVLDNAMTETGAVVVEAMREIVAHSGGILVRGIR